MKYNPFFLEVHRAFTAKMEGGYCDVKEDAGGATNYGISLLFLQSAEKQDKDFLQELHIQLPVSVQSIKNLTLAQSEALYNRFFWQACQCEDFAPHVAFMLYDSAVNHGVMGGVKIAQKALNALGQKEPLVEDGILGPKTKALLEKPSGAVFISTFARIRAETYENIVKNRANQMIFLQGWLRRAKEMGDFAQGLLTT